MFLQPDLDQVGDSFQDYYPAHRLDTYTMGYPYTGCKLYGCSKYYNDLNSILFPVLPPGGFHLIQVL